MRTITGLAVLLLVSVTASEAQEGETTSAQPPPPGSSAQLDAPDDLVWFSVPYRESISASDGSPLQQSNIEPGTETSNTGGGFAITDPWFRGLQPTNPSHTTAWTSFGLRSNVVAEKFDRFLDKLEPTLDAIFDRTESVAGRHTSAYSVEEIDIHVGIHVNGKVVLVEAGATASVTLKLRRTDSTGKAP